MAGKKAQGNKARESYFKNYASEDRGQKNKEKKYAARVRKMQRKGHSPKFLTLADEQEHCRKVCAKANTKKAAA